MSDEPKKDDPKDEQPESTEPDPKEAFKEGVNLLWHAARGAFGGLRKEIEKADIPGGLRDAAEEMKRAADAALHGKPRETEPEWVQPAKQGARIATDDEPADPSAATEAAGDEDAPQSDGDDKSGESS
jgi:hypothetical protein